MKLGVLTCLLSDRSIDEAIKLLASFGVEAAEVGCGGATGDAHCKSAELLVDDDKFEEFKKVFKKNHMEISALDCHCNPVHPDIEVNKAVNKNLNDTILLAEKLKVKNVVTFAGCPGEPGGKYPNWIVQPWPTEFEELYTWQWNEVVIPYWKKEAEFAKKHNVTLCIEMHPGFVVYNPYTMLKLYNAVGSDSIGCTCDPSNIVWQGIDVPTAIRELGPIIKHVHIKDSIESMQNIAKNGRIDARNYSDRTNRAWSFRTVGYGHGELYWKNIISAFVDSGYDGVLSIEHEDTYMNNIEGLKKAIKFLDGIMIREKAGEMSWANTDNVK